MYSIIRWPIDSSLPKQVVGPFPDYKTAHLWAKEFVPDEEMYRIVPCLKPSEESLNEIKNFIKKVNNRLIA